MAPQIRMHTILAEDPAPMLCASQQPPAPWAPALVCTYAHTDMIGYKGRLYLGKKRGI